MIAITKPSRNAYLDANGPAATAAICRRIDAGEKLRSEDFDKNVFAHPSVKADLIASHRSKCCFCERIVAEDGQVEHYRPKAGFQRDKNGKLERPGYYWLAYDWDNLLLSCYECNVKYKRNHFPIHDEATRATKPGDHTVEEPLLINPTTENPEPLITWDSAIPKALHPKAAKTIEILELDKRHGLLASRQQHFADIWELAKILRECRRRRLAGTAGAYELTLEADTQAHLATRIQPNQEFAAMTRAALADLRL